MVLLQPAQLLAMWTVGHHADHVAPLGPANQRMDAVEQLVRAGEPPHRRRRRMHHHAFQRFHRGSLAPLTGRHALHLKIPAPLVEELREPHLRPLARQRVLPVGLASTHRTPIDRAVVMDQLRRRDSHHRARRSRHLHPRHNAGVLTQIVHRYAGLELLHRHWREHLERADRRRRTRQPLERPAGPVHLLRRRPTRVVEVGTIPPRRFQASVIILPAIDARERDRPRMRSPSSVRAHDLRGPVRIVQP